MAKGGSSESNFEAAHFPLEINSLNNMTKITLGEIGDLEDHHDLLSNAVEGIEAGGTALKNSARAATTKAELDAVVDTR